MDFIGAKSRFMITTSSSVLFTLFPSSFQEKATHYTRGLWRNIFYRSPMSFLKAFHLQLPECASQASELTALPPGLPSCHHRNRLDRRPSAPAAAPTCTRRPCAPAWGTSGGRGRRRMEKTRSLRLVPRYFGGSISEFAHVQTDKLE